MIDKALFDQTEERMKKSISSLRTDLSTVRAGRASAALLDRVTVSYYGSDVPLNQVASISVPEARLIVVQPWDKNAINDIERAIMKSDIGLNPSSDGTVIRLPVPQLTEERRKELLKLVKNMSEEARIAIRNIRRDTIEEIRKLEKDHNISKDDLEAGREDTQKLTDRFIQEVDQILSHKEKEIMEI